MKNRYMIDLHCDTISALYELRKQKQVIELDKNSIHVDLERMKEANYLLMHFAIFFSIKQYPQANEQFLILYQLFKEEIEKYKNEIMQIFSYTDIVKAKEENKVGIMLTVEEGEVCQGEIEKLYQLYECGVRMMTLTWNHPNQLAHPTSMQEKGLTKIGEEFVLEMERMGMLIDVSHLSDQGINDVLNIVKCPIVASHSNAREICNEPRNLQDKHIRQIGEGGGIIGLNLYPDFLGTHQNIEEVKIAVLRHIKQFINLGGEDCLALGSDFDGMEGNPWIKGVQDIGKIAEFLEGEGINSSIIDKLCYKNVLRLYKEVL